MKRILSESKAGVWGNAFTTTITQQHKLTLFEFLLDCHYFYETYREKVDNCCDCKV